MNLLIISLSLYKMILLDFGSFGNQSMRDKQKIGHRTIRPEDTVET